jgi:hypothetical protein
LAKARLYFLNQKVKKSGKNMHLEFKYFELEDIVPPALRIFARVGLTTNIKFADDHATMNVYNTDSDEPPIPFTVPYREVKPIISNQGKEVTNPMQALGSSITYLRRYLWMAVLDITEPDDIDATLGADDGEVENEFAEEAAAVAAPAKKEKKQKPPATAADRKAAKKELTQADGAASDEQIAKLKEICKVLMDKDEDQEEFVQQIALKTQGFSQISASACEELIKNLEEMVAAYNG